MVLQLKIKNFAIIDDLEVNFKEGMTVLTGETGAGKSLIIDSISLLLGQRADSDMIRYGAKEARIEGVFQTDKPSVFALLERFGIKGDSITIKRILSVGGKNVIQVNQTNISLMQLRQIAVLLADIHTQNDTYRLFNPESYFELITPKEDGNYDALFATYSLSYLKYLEELKQYQKILKGQKESMEHLDRLRFEMQELSSLHLYEGIDEELEKTVLKLQNYDKIFSSLSGAYQCLENEYFSLEQLYRASSELEKIKSLDQSFQDDQEKLLDSYYLLDEIKQHLSKELRMMDYSEAELNQATERLLEIEKAKTKYGKCVRELIAYLEEIKLEIALNENYDAVLDTQKKTVIQLYEQVKKNALLLSDYRKKHCLKIEAGILKECRALDLEQTAFSIHFSSTLKEDPFDSEQFDGNGIDRVDFLISFNDGEPKHSLHKVASGGEMSRVMLAFKGYFAAENRYAVMVFDEIDTGVSGATAKKIALKLLQISKGSQVLCITHLPQVAAIGDWHIRIYKRRNDGRTTTHIEELDFEARMEEVALMLSGDKMSVYALEHAKALLQEKNDLK